MAPRLYSDPAAGFKHLQQRKGGDTALQANTLLSGLATTVGTEEMLGSSTVLLVQVGCHSREAPGTVVAPERFPHTQHMAQEHHPHLPAPTKPICSALFLQISSLRGSIANICADLEGTARSVLAEQRAGEMQSQGIIKQTNQVSCTCFSLHPSLQ